MYNRRRSRSLALILSLVPGWGHVYFGRETLGLIIFTLFAVAGFGFLNGLFLYLGSWGSFLIVSSAVLFVLVATGSWVDILRITSSRQVSAEEASREAHLRRGTEAYLQGDLTQAGTLLRACVRADPFDIEALFRLGVVCARSGDLLHARTCFRRTLKHDPEEKWRWEVGRELEALKKSMALLPTGGRPVTYKETEANSV